MKGDFSRDSFDPLRSFSRVLMQQGRVQLDSDWNEQVAILLYLLRRLAADLVGPHGGPEGTGFEIGTQDPDGDELTNDLWIGKGHYYVDGWLTESPGITYRDQALYEEGEAHDLTESDKKYLAYLDAWERHVSSVEVDGSREIALRDPILLRELALGGPDTASRAQVVWRVHLLDLTDLPDELTPQETPVDWKEWFRDANRLEALRDHLRSSRRGRLRAMAKSGHGEVSGPCAIPPESRYRGLENQLYRVEIHRGGRGADVEADADTGVATFKWSRDNGSVVFGIADIDDRKITLSQWWRDQRAGLEIGQWVELGDDADATARKPDSNVLRRITAVDPDRMTVTLDERPHITHADAKLHPWLRRWDHGQRRAANDDAMRMDDASNTLYVVEDEDTWIELEDGVRIQFANSNSDDPHVYRPGDYWLIPARTAIGDVVWPRTPSGNGEYDAEGSPPHGVEHHFAPLAIVSVGVNGTVTPEPLRLHFDPLAE